MEQITFWEVKSHSFKFPAFYRTWRFVTMFTRGCHWSLFWARSIQSTPFHLAFLRSIL